MSSLHPTTRDALDFIHASPTPHHCVAEVVRRLSAQGFTVLEERAPWKLEAGKGYVVTREGGAVAFRVGRQPAAASGFRIIGAHTDSPNLRVKPLPDVDKEGYRQLGVEVYGGSLTYTWLDRDLGMAGVVVLRNDGKRGEERLQKTLVRIDRPILRVPSLAIHLDREVRTKGLDLNDQKHLVPVFGLGAETPGEAKKKRQGPGALKQLLSHELDVDPERILSWELSLFDVVPPAAGGPADEFIFSPRLDNQAMCHAALVALTRTSAADPTSVVCLYDHEEVGSGSISGAAGPFVEDALRRIAEVEGPGAVAGGLTRAVPRSIQISADMAHAVHPNYADRHEPEHHPRLNGGPVIKVNVQQRYATGAETAALFEALCQEAQVPYQKFVSRTDLPCGSTIGPISAARLGVRTVDVGNPMLSMHSIREQAGAHDPERMTAVLALFLAGT